MNDENQKTSGKRYKRAAEPERDKALILQRIIAELTPLSAESRRRMIDTVSTFFGIAHPRIDSDWAMTDSGGSGGGSGGGSASSSAAAPFRFSESEAPSPKDFIREKSPKTDVERVACLAYYLARYRSTPHFKTNDITALSIEAAHRRFSNPTDAVNNAAKMGYLVPSVKGCKQLSAAGEQFIQALPDREAAQEVQDRLKPRKGRKRPLKKAARTSQS